MSIKSKGFVISIDHLQIDHLYEFPLSQDRFAELFKIVGLLSSKKIPNRGLFSLFHNLDDPFSYIPVAASLGVQVFLINDRVLTSSENLPLKAILRWTDHGDFWLLPKDSKLALWHRRGIMLSSANIPPHYVPYPVPVVSYPIKGMSLSAYDLGGAGDCLILCFMARFFDNSILPTIQSHYNYLEVFSGSFLEDDSLVKLCFLYKTNAFVARMIDSKIQFVYYQVSDSFIKDICLLNLYPHHFCLIRSLSYDNVEMVTRTFKPVSGCFSDSDLDVLVDVNLTPVHIKRYFVQNQHNHYILQLLNTFFLSCDTTNLLLKSVPEYLYYNEFNAPLGFVSPVKPLFVEEDFLEDDDFAFGPDDEEIETNEDLGLELLPSNSNIETIFNYMRCHPFMVSDSVKDVVKCFQSLHFEVCNKTLELANDGMSLPSIFYKYYYKCRHNTFAFICTQGKTTKPIALETDMPLSVYIKSDKTPDLIIEDLNSITIFEYTVANRYEQADFVKGGGLVDRKYQAEADLISQVVKKSVKVVIVPCILNEYNINEISELMPHELEIELLREFIDICNKSRDMLASSYFSSNRSSEGLLRGKYEMAGTSDSISIDAFFISIILKNWSWFLSYCVNLSTREKPPKKISLCYEIISRRSNLDIEPSKNMTTSSLNDLITILENRDLSAIISLLNVFEGSKKVGLQNIQGDVVITYKSPKFKERKYIYQPPMTELKYFSKSKSPKSKYDDIDSWDDSLIIKRDPILYDFDDKYLDKLCNHSYSKLLKSNSLDLLANNIIDNDYIDESVSLLKESYSIENHNPRMKFSPKPSFTWPFVTGTIEMCSLSLDKVFLRKIASEISGKYTKDLLIKASEGRFYTEAERSEELDLITSQYSTARQKCTSFMLKNGLVKRFSLMTPEERKLLKTVRDPMIDLQQKRSKMLSEAKRKSINLVKLSSRGKAIARNWFQDEMKHYDKINKGLKGVGSISNVGSLISYFKELHVRIQTKQHNMNLPRLYNLERSPGCKFLNQQKDNFTNRWEDFYKESFSGSLLEQLGIFINRLSKFLFNESMKPYNSDYVKIDNLGFTGVIVLVRGGKKAIANNCTRLFRVLFPINGDDLFYSGYEQNENYQKIKLDAENYILTPWSQLHLDSIYDGFTARERMFTSWYSAATRTDTIHDVEPSALNVLPHTLMLNNRRKTESLMHNLRYLIVNPLGECANIKGIIKSFGTFNHSYYDAWIKESICLNYSDFAKKIHSYSKQKNKTFDSLLRDNPLKDMFFNMPIVNVEQLTFHIYGTYLMTKAPVNNTLEQVNNLKEVLQDVVDYENLHDDVSGMEDKSQHINVFSFSEEAYKDDFTYDPTFCQYLGYHMSSFLRNKITPAEMETKWKSLMDQGISEIANSHGLRGYKKDNFFSKKGFEVVFDKVIDMLEKSDSSLEDMVNNYMELDYRTACSAVKQDMIKKSEFELDQITFHIVHKIQRGGGREIFCMDLMTKMFQNPIEMFMKFLCKRVPNEFISIPSSKRHQLIHRDFYERRPSPWIKETIRWVLDCRRWAPHSVFQKYVHFIHGMSSFLPGEFVDYFGAFAEKMFDKEFCTRQHVVNAIDKNATFSELKNLLKQDVKIPGKFNFKVKFSFVMGIFNYLSTLMHAANQLVASEVCMRNSLSNKRGLVIMDAKCHSDDSVVTTYHEENVSVKPTVLIYDWLLKCSNHMLSIKKSQINRNVYLEFLSTLYLFDRFVPVVPKFISSIPFKPTDLGYSTDVTFAASQSIEMLLQGGTIEESYLMLKISEKFIQGIYHLNPNHNLPYSLMGNIDSHPIELLLSGVESDILNHFMYNKTQLVNATNILAQYKIISKSGLEGFTIVWDMSSKVSNRLKDKYKDWKPLVEELSSRFPWTLTQCKLGNDYLQLLWYINKLNNPKYYASMIQEPDARLFSKAFGSFNYRNIILTNGSIMKVSDLTNILQFPAITEIDDVSSEYYSSLNEMNPYLADLHDVLCNTTDNQNNLPTSFKPKPVSLNITSSRVDRLKISTQSAISYIYEPDAFRLLGMQSDPKRQVMQIKEQVASMNLSLPEEDPNTGMKIINFALGRKEPNFSLIAAVPSEEKRIEDYNGLIIYLTHNSLFNKILDITNTRADIIDWSKKVSRGKTPSAVLDFMEIKQLEDIAIACNINQYDIFKTPLSVLLKSSFEQIPIQWKPLIYTSQKKTIGNLIEEQYWTAWIKSQVKVGRIWYGSGKCLLSIPESIIRFEMLNGCVSKIATREETHCEFSTTSNWYIMSLLRMPGLKLPTMSSDQGLDSKDYFGYSEKSGRYGIGSPRSFDRIFEEPVSWGIREESILYNTEYIANEGRYYIAKGLDQNIRIEFFTPGIESNKIDAARFLSREKLEKHINIDNVKRFCLKMSYDLRSEFSFKKQDVVDTIGFTKLYKLIHNNPDSMSVFRGTNNEDAFYESFPLWKQTHSEFGFPSEDEIEQLINDEFTPKLPGRLLRLIHKLGKSSIPNSEKENIISNMYSMPKENRLQYLFSVLGGLNTEDASNMLVLAMRTRRFYESCQFLGRNTFTIFTPLMNLLSNVLTDSPCYSETLDMIHFKYSRSHSRDHVFKMIVSRILFVAIHINTQLSSDDPICQVFLKIIEELFESGMGKTLNALSVRIPILNVIEFDVEKDIFLKMMVDVLDSLYLTPWDSKRYPQDSKKVLFPYKEHYGNYMKGILMLRNWMIPRGLKIKTKKGKKTITAWMRNTRPKPGIVDSKFVPLDDDDQDEFEAGYEYAEDPEEDLMFADVGEAPEIRFINIPSTDRLTMLSVRGTAGKLIIKTNIINKDLFNCYGIKKIRVKNSFTSLEDYLGNYGGAYVYIGNEGSNFDIDDTKPWSLDDHHRIINRYPSSEIVIEGKSRTKIELMKNPYLINQLPSIDNFFLKSATTKIEEDIEEVEMIEKTKDQLRDDFPKFKKSANKYLGWDQEEIAEEEEGVNEALDVNKIVNLYKKHKTVIENWIGGSQEVKKAMSTYTTSTEYNYAESMKMLFDPETLGEFNTLYGNSWSRFENNEIRLTKLTKKVKIQRALYQITRMQKNDKEKYSKILFITSVLLAAIPEVESPRLEDHEFSRIIDELFDVDVDVDIPFDIMAALTPNPGEISKPPDLDRIFGKIN